MKKTNKYKHYVLTINRLKGGQQNVEVWQSILAVHSLVIPPQEELDMWLKFIGLCRKV